MPPNDLFMLKKWFLSPYPAVPTLQEDKFVELIFGPKRVEKGENVFLLYGAAALPI